MIGTHSNIPLGTVKVAVASGTLDLLNLFFWSSGGRALKFDDNGVNETGTLVATTTPSSIRTLWNTAQGYDDDSNAWDKYVKDNQIRGIGPIELTADLELYMGNDISTFVPVTLKANDFFYAGKLPTIAIPQGAAMRNMGAIHVDRVLYAGQIYKVATIGIDEVGANGDKALVALASDEKQIILQMFIDSAGTETVQFFDGPSSDAKPIGGPHTLTAQDGFVLPPGGSMWMQTSSGKAFVMKTTTGSVQLSGFIASISVPA